eukprot:scaffold89009_cov17-Tisochrysis_lutea.AAC.1
MITSQTTASLSSADISQLPLFHPLGCIGSVHRPWCKGNESTRIAHQSRGALKQAWSFEEVGPFWPQRKFKHLLHLRKCSRLLSRSLCGTVGAVPRGSFASTETALSDFNKRGKYRSKKDLTTLSMKASR